jgi:uncharacterized protein with von Willebrand factor type A (vWA) domain
MFIPFFQLLRDQGLPVGLRHVLEFYEALERGLAPDLDRLFVLLRLIFVKKLEHFDVFEQTFAAYFLGAEHEPSPRLSRELWESKAFRRWLDEEISRGALAEDDFEKLPLEDLLRRFWEVAVRQAGEHRRGHTWIGTGGASPFGHSGAGREGIQAYGKSVHGSALKVIEGRRYIDYAATTPLRAENVRQALAALKHMVPVGPATALDVDETVARSARNGGEIDLIFRRELRDRIQVVVLLDNGGASMVPYVDMVKLVFAKMRDQLRDLDYYYFHNCIYGCVYSDSERRSAYPLHQLLRRDPETRLILIGDANMAPAELLLSNGAIDYFSKARVPGREWLLQLRGRFPRSVWLNPICREHWAQESSTISSVREIFPMEDLTLSGIRQAVERLNTGGSPCLRVAPSPRRVPSSRRADQAKWIHLSLRPPGDGIKLKVPGPGARLEPVKAGGGDHSRVVGAEIRPGKVEPET